MSARAPGHAERERVVFDAFLRAHPTLGRNVAGIQQPDDDPPDIIAAMIDGTRVNFELVEWLRGEQMISRSPADVQPVFDMIAESAAPLCDAIDVTIFHVDWNVLRVSLRFYCVTPPPTGRTRR